MKPFISTTLYGVINWAGSLLLITSPFFLGYYKVGGAALFLPLLIGWLEFIMAVFSDNEHGLIRVFPMEMHLFLDVVVGSFLLASPFVYAFSDKIFWPQLLLGGLFFIAGIFTKKSPLTTAPHNVAEGQLTSVDSEEGRLSH
jgi:hypothetical protein